MKKKVNYDVLNIVKIVAIFGIVFHHYQQFTNIRFNTFINFYGGKINIGYLVELFFMISGILINKYREDIKAGMDIKVFLKKRYFRLYPLATISVLITAVTLYTYQELANVELRYSTLTWWNILNSALGVNFLTPTIECINIPLWYISELLLCYLIFYGCAFFEKRIFNAKPYLPYILMVIVGFVILINRINYPILNQGLGRGLSSFFLGVLLYDKLKVDGNKFKKNIASLMCIISIIAVLSFDICTKYQNYLFMLITYPSLLFWACRTEINNEKIKEIINYVTKVSYSVYLIHFPLIVFILLINKIYNFSLYNDFGWMIFFGIFSFGIGCLIYTFVEVPLKAFINRKS